MQALARLHAISSCTAGIRAAERCAEIKPQPLLPGRTLLAEKPDGWAAFRMWCFLESISTAFCWAYLPQSRKTSPFLRALSMEMAASVKFSHPCLPWDAASCARTVSTALSRNTP